MAFRMRIFCGDVLGSDYIRGRTPCVGEKLDLMGWEDDDRHEGGGYGRRVSTTVKEVTNFVTVDHTGFSNLALVTCDVDDLGFRRLRATSNWEFMEL